LKITLKSYGKKFLVDYFFRNFLYVLNCFLDFLFWSYREKNSRARKIDETLKITLKISKKFKWKKY